MKFELKDIVDEEITGISTGGTFDELLGSPVKQGDMLKVISVCCENKTTAYTKAVFGIKHGSDFTGLCDIFTLDANVIAWDTDTKLIMPGSCMVVRMYGCTAADVLRMHIQGYFYEIRG